MIYYTSSLAEEWITNAIKFEWAGWMIGAQSHGPPVNGGKFTHLRIKLFLVVRATTASSF